MPLLSGSRPGTFMCPMLVPDACTERNSPLSPQVCSFYLLNGACKYGRACLKHHPNIVLRDNVRWALEPAPGPDGSGVAAAGATSAAPPLRRDSAAAQNAMRRASAAAPAAAHSAPGAQASGPGALSAGRAAMPAAHWPPASAQPALDERARQHAQLQHGEVGRQAAPASGAGFAGAPRPHTKYSSSARHAVSSPRAAQAVVGGQRFSAENVGPGHIFQLGGQQAGAPAPASGPLTGQGSCNPHAYGGFGTALPSFAQPGAVGAAPSSPPGAGISGAYSALGQPMPRVETMPSTVVHRAAAALTPQQRASGPAGGGNGSAVGSGLALPPGVHVVPNFPGVQLQPGQQVALQIHADGSAVPIFVLQQ